MKFDACSHIICALSPGYCKQPLNCNLHLNLPALFIYGAVKKFVVKSHSVLTRGAVYPTVCVYAKVAVKGVVDDGA